MIENWKEHPVGSRGIPKGWKEQSWGRPNYDLFSIAEDGSRALHLKSRGDSSSIAKEITGTVNLKVTPILEWSWKMVELPRGGDSRRAATDDQAGQLYVIWRRFPEMLRSRVIGYIWDTTAPAGEIVKSQKTGTVTYVIVRSGPAEVGQVDHRAPERRGRFHEDLRRGSRQPQRHRGGHRLRRHEVPGGVVHGPHPVPLAVAPRR